MLQKDVVNSVSLPFIFAIRFSHALQKAKMKAKQAPQSTRVLRLSV